MYLHSNDLILTVNSLTWKCWNRSHAVPLLPLTVPYITPQRSCPVVKESWKKSPIKSVDMPPKMWSELYNDDNVVSKKRSNCILDMETSSTMTILGWFPPSDLNMTFIAVPALKLGANVLKTLWKVWPCGKCKAPTPVGHVQRQISLRKANSSKKLHVTKIFPFPQPACSNTSFYVNVSRISTKIPNCSSFYLLSESKLEAVFHLSSAKPSLWSNNITFKLFDCSSVKWQTRYTNCFFVKVVWLMPSNNWYVSFVHT